MRTLKRLFQFISIYTVAIGLLWGIKIVYGFSDYLIPPPLEVLQVADQNGLLYVKAVMDWHPNRHTHSGAKEVSVFVGNGDMIPFTAL